MFLLQNINSYFFKTIFLTKQGAPDKLLQGKLDLFLYLLLHMNQFSKCRLIFIKNIKKTKKACFSIEHFFLVN